MCVSVFEILIPLFFAVIILIVRFEAKSDERTYPTYYPPENVHQQNFTYRYMGEHVELGYVPNTLLATNLMTSVLEKFTKELNLSKVNTRVRIRRRMRETSVHPWRSNYYDNETL
ncbi:hypothetical protein C0Q70_15719 [Pomacea canaliculata]|uniref:Uncharacterized protein n=1 Tax=Pomacea canaliculata TaxID=400727 RepID=A0A2T7NVM4_POMCA|nr:hypothetical protein C0Q70_15719 [Pomacea canaliculata]